MINRDKLIKFINKTLKYEPDKDPHLVNGLTVEGKEKIKKIVLGVSPNLELFKKAVNWQADVIILHHGIFRPKTAPIINILKKRIKTLLDNNISLLTYHLFLDNHPTLGNNAQLIKLLGAKREKEFGRLEKLFWGFEGSYQAAITAKELEKRCKKLCGSSVHIFKYGPHKIKKIAVVSGGGPYFLQEAIDKNLDAYITGEARESTEALAKEAGIHFIWLGHYNSEKFGVLALGKFLKKKFPKLQIRFIDIPNRI